MSAPLWFSPTLPLKQTTKKKQIKKTKDIFSTAFDEFQFEEPSFPSYEIPSFAVNVVSLCEYSLEANYLIWVWIIKVKGPKIKLILLKYYMWELMPWAPLFELHGNMVRILKLFPSVLKSGAP